MCKLEKVAADYNAKTLFYGVGVWLIYSTQAVAAGLSLAVAETLYEFFTSRLAP